MLGWRTIDPKKNVKREGDYRGYTEISVNEDSAFVKEK